MPSVNAGARTMRTTSLQVAMDTLIAASPLLNHELEDRSRIRHHQDSELGEKLGERTARRLRGRSQRDLFCVAPLDILVSEQDGRKQFHLLELNGTGIGGLSNLPDFTAATVLRSLSESCSSLHDPNGVVLMAVSGKESAAAPRLNRLMHEKLLFVDAIRAGLNRTFGRSEIRCLEQLGSESIDTDISRPTVVLGYIKDLLGALEVRSDGTLSLMGRSVMGAVNDRFCANVLQHFPGQIDLKQLATFNRCFAAGSDKGIAYELLDEFVQAQPHPAFPNRVHYAHAATRDELIATVLEWLQKGRQVVIKPHGTGLGHGIEFFFSSSEPADDIIERIDGSLAQTAEYYGIAGGALPYTICEYVDATTVAAPEHPLQGHKFELRVVVYRDGNTLRAFPSIAKVARERAAEGTSVRRSLINNVTASGDTEKVRGTDYVLPLCNQRTLQTLDLTLADIQHLCQLSTSYVRYVLDQVEDQPGRFGLPGMGTRETVSSESVLAAA
jgi:hypothetical protein